ncbi:MAG: HAD family phosphatase [Balneolaceae bacterium]
MNSPFGAIFDMDGVIVHSNPAHKIAIRQFCKKHNLNVSDDFLERKIYGRTNKEWIPELFGELDEAEINRLADEKEALFRSMFDPEKEIVPGLREFLQNLKSSGIPTVVATSAPGDNADFILGRLKIRDMFQTVLDSSHVERGKPEPEVYLKASAALNLPPEQCFVFEDSIAGVQAGVRAGAKVIGVSTTHSPGELNGCIRVISSFTGLAIHELQELL